MEGLFSTSAEYFEVQSFSSLVALYWFVLFFEIPRYTIPFMIAAFTPRPGRGAARRADLGRVTVAVVGHNEGDSIDTCIAALREQSWPPDEIIAVSDGSTDDMTTRIRALVRSGTIDGAHSVDLRAGKSAGMNLAVRMSTGDIVIIVDCDCTFDRHALRNILSPFDDPSMGGVSGNILPRNARASLIAQFQAIEYLISISLGRIAGGNLDSLACISGAFGAFRREAFEQVGGLDAGGGEDLDLTLKLRKAGWRVGFVADAICYTDVPTTLTALVRQRFRWERDSVALRYRRHGGTLNPLTGDFRISELFHQFEFLLFNIIAAAALPFYLIWLIAICGSYTFVVLLGAQIGLMLLDLVTFLLAAYAMPRAEKAGMLPYVFGYSLFNGVVMRTVRLAAYVQEWVFEASYRDPYCPEKVQMERFRNG